MDSFMVVMSIILEDQVTKSSKVTITLHYYYFLLIIKGNNDDHKTDLNPVMYDLNVSRPKHIN